MQASRRCASDRPTDARPAPKPSGGAPNPRELTAAHVHAGCIWTASKCKVDPSRLDPCDVKKKRKCNKKTTCVWAGKTCMLKGSNEAIAAQLEDVQAQLQDASGVTDEVAASLQQTIDGLQDGPDDEGEEAEGEEAEVEPLPKGAFASHAELKAAVDAWAANTAETQAELGHISGWDV